MITVQGLADAIYTEMNTTYGIPSQGEAETRRYLKVLAEGIVKYLVANIEVLPGTFVVSGFSGNIEGIGKIK